MDSHPISAQQRAQLTQYIGALNAAEAALRLYFSAIADGLGLTEGTTLVRVEDNTVVVTPPAPVAADQAAV